MVPTARLLKM